MLGAVDAIGVQQAIAYLSNRFGIARLHACVQGRLRERWGGANDEAKKQCPAGRQDRVWGVATRSDHLGIRHVRHWFIHFMHFLR
jgi:hypothetical protein